MATSSYKTFLMHKTGEVYEKLVDIKDFPDLGGVNLLTSMVVTFSSPAFPFNPEKEKWKLLSLSVPPISTLTAGVPVLSSTEAVTFVILAFAPFMFPISSSLTSLAICIISFCYCVSSVFCSAILALYSSCVIS